MATPTPSSAPAVKRALITLFKKELESQPGVQIAYAHPLSNIQQEAIYFGRTMESEVAAALGQKRRDEDYELELVVDVVQDGDDAEAAEIRCFELVAILELAVRANPGRSGDAIGDVVNGWVVWKSYEMTPHPEQGQRLAEAVCRIEVKNRK
jgi:hypothetical protein